jgi:hypothetical protein
MDNFLQKFRICAMTMAIGAERALVECLAAAEKPGCIQPKRRTEIFFIFLAVTH